jgi:hypothetical protein
MLPLLVYRVRQDPKKSGLYHTDILFFRGEPPKRLGSVQKKLVLVSDSRVK